MADRYRSYLPIIKHYVWCPTLCGLISTRCRPPARNLWNCSLRNAPRSKDLAQNASISQWMKHTNMVSNIAGVHRFVNNISNQIGKTWVQWVSMYWTCGCWYETHWSWKHFPLCSVYIFNFKICIMFGFLHDFSCLCYVLALFWVFLLYFECFWAKYMYKLAIQYIHKYKRCRFVSFVFRSLRHHTRYPFPNRVELVWTFSVSASRSLSCET